MAVSDSPERLASRRSEARHADERAARLAPFLRTELAGDAARRRGAARIVLSSAIAIVLIQSLHIPQGAWILITIFVLSLPNAGATTIKALDRVSATVVACVAGIILSVAVVDIPWLRVPIGALGGGLAIFLARTTTHPYAALLGGITFCMFLLGNAQTAAEVATFGLWRTLLIAVGVAIVLIVDLYLLPSDPEAQLLADLRKRLGAIEAALARTLAATMTPARSSTKDSSSTAVGPTTAHQPTTGHKPPPTLRALVVGLPNQIDLLTASEARHPSLRRRHVEQIALITVVENLLTAAIALERALAASGADVASGPFAARIEALRAGVASANDRLASFPSNRALTPALGTAPTAAAKAEAHIATEIPAATAAPGTHVLETISPLVEAQAALLPAVLDLENGLALLERVLGTGALKSAAARLSASLPPSPLDAPPTGWLTPNFSLANTADIRMSLKAALAMFLFYLLMTGMAWPGIETGIVTVIVIANATNGAMLHKATLRLIGAAIGGAMAIAVIVIAMPNMTTLAPFLIVCSICFAAAAWVTAGSARISYAGVQMAIAFALCLMDSLGPTTNLEPPRDRIMGVLLSDTLTTLVFYSLWPVSARSAMRASLIASLRAISSLLLVGAHLDKPAPVAPARGHRWQFYQALNQTVLMADESGFEAEGWSEPGTNARRAVRGLVPLVQETFLGAVAIVRHRLAAELATTPAAFRDAMHLHSIAVGAHLEAVARRFEGRAETPLPDLHAHLEEARAAAIAQRDEILAAPGGADTLAHVEARIEIHAELVDTLEQLERAARQVAGVVAAPA